jgi:opacity protein-like surface antigen
MFIVTAMFLSLFATSASGESGTGGISLSAGLTPIGGGDAGGVSGAPTYDEAYDKGWTARIEPYYDFHPLVRGQVGVAYNQWGGKTFSGVRFEDLKVRTYYVGVKIRFLPNSKIRPYVVSNIGAAQISGVNVSLPNVPGAQLQYWDSTTTAFFDIGGGVEFNIAPNVSFFLDTRVQATGKPKSA